LESMDETYRMLGREHQAELEREADRRRLAAAARATEVRARPKLKLLPRGIFRLRLARLAALLR
jgi:hypothetical protein